MVNFHFLKYLKILGLNLIFYCLFYHARIEFTFLTISQDKYLCLPRMQKNVGKCQECGVGHPANMHCQYNKP